MHNYSQLTFSTIIPDLVVKYSKNNAMRFVGEEPVTYLKMGETIEALKSFIEHLDIIPGDRVAVLSQNMPNWGMVYIAIQCMGIIAVPILPDFSSHELQNILNHSEAKALFVSENLEYKLEEIEKEKIEVIVNIDTFKVLEAKNKPVVFDINARCKNSYITNENDLSILLYTSGTTGGSKGVMLSQKNVIFNAFQGANIQPILEKEQFLSVLPLSHTYENTLGLILPLLFGACINYLRKPPTASVLIPAMQEVKPELMLTVPMIIEKVYKNSILPEIKKKMVTRIMHKFFLTRKIVNRIAGKKLYQKFGGKLKFFGIGGAKLDPVVEKFLRDAKFPYAIGYGLTETSPLLAGSNPTNTKFQAIGPVVNQCELIINNPDKHSGEGEIWAKGPNVMLGYYKNEKTTREVITENGWFKTGDLGVFDKKGWLSHKGRLKNIIVGANGENIYPEDIESIINNFRHVIESIVLQKKGKLVAMVHFNREELELKVKEMKTEFTSLVDEKIEELKKKVDDLITELAEELKNYVNSKVNRYSRIQLMIVHPEPFTKTATKKIKRYLYY